MPMADRQAGFMGKHQHISTMKACPGLDTGDYAIASPSRLPCRR